MQQDANSSLVSLRDVFRILFRHKRKAFATFSVLTILTVVALGVVPRTYLSESKVYIRVGRESVGLDPTTTTGQTLSLQESRESEIQSVMDLLTSQIIFEKVLDRIGEDNIIRCSLEAPEPGESDFSFDPVGMLRSIALLVLPSDDVSPREEAIRRLQRWVYVAGSKKSSVITVACKCGDPAVAQRVVQEFVDVYRGEHARVNRTAGSAKFLEAQVTLLQQRLDESTQRLRDAKNHVGLISIDSKKTIIQLQISNLNQTIVETESALTSAQSRVRSLTRRVPDWDVEQWHENGSGLSGTAVDEMRDRLYELQIRERELMAKYQPAHPALIAVRDQAEEAQRILTRQELAIELSTVASLKAKLDGLQEKLVALDQQLRNLNESELVINDIQQEIDLLRKSYRSYKDKLELARFDQELVSEDITNINIVQPATYNAKAVSPKKSIVLGLGLIMATFGGLGISLLGELFDNSFTTPEQLELKLDVPVLLSIPQIHRQSNGERLLLN